MAQGPWTGWVADSPAGVPQVVSRGTGPSEVIIEFPMSQEPGVTGDARAVELQLEVAVEVHAQGLFWPSPLGVLRRSSGESSITLGFAGI